MSLLLPRPSCSPRRVDEFNYGSEFQRRLSAPVPPAAWAQYRYGRRHIAGLQTEPRNLG